MFVHPYWICLLALTGTIDAEFWSSWRLRQKNRRICEKFWAVYDSVDGEAEQKDACFHKHCTASLGSQWKLQQAKQQQQGEENQTCKTQKSEQYIPRTSRRHYSLLHKCPTPKVWIWKGNCNWCRRYIYVSVLAAYVAHHVEENLHRKRKRVIYDWRKKNYAVQNMLKS